MGRKNRNRRKRLYKEKKKIRRSKTKIESKVAQFLDCLGISYRQNASVSKYSVDFLIDKKYIIEAYGDYWHCNPVKYPPDYYSRGLKCAAHEKWSKDTNRQHELEKMGYKFLILWEQDINKSPKLCKIKVKRLLDGS